MPVKSSSYQWQPRSTFGNDEKHNHVLIAANGTHRIITLNQFLLLSEQVCNAASSPADHLASVSPPQTRLPSKVTQNDHLSSLMA